MATFALSRSKPPYKIAVYAPGQKVQCCLLMHYIIASTYTYHNEVYKLSLTRTHSFYSCVCTWGETGNEAVSCVLMKYWMLYCPQGAPSFVRLYEYPRLEGPGAIVASKSFYRADTVSFLWNNKGGASNNFPAM